MGLPDLETYKQMISMVADYTDGYLLTTSWGWRNDAVDDGEEVGLCVQQGEGDYASCWSYRKSSWGYYESTNASYLIDVATLNEESNLSDYQNIGEEVFPALYGGWLCSQVMEFYDMARVDCMRFIPSEMTATQRDPRIRPGEVNIATYLSGRDPTDLAPMEGMPFNTWVATKSFENFTIDLMGAMSGVTAASAAVVAGIAATLF